MSPHLKMDSADAVPPIGPVCNHRAIVRSYRQLRFVSEVLLMDSKMDERPFILESDSLRDCKSLARAWKGYLGHLKVVGSRKPRLVFVINSYDKGTRSLFDYECLRCDTENGRTACSDWWERVSSSSESTPPSVLRNLRKYARFLLGGGRADAASEEDRRSMFWEGDSDIPDVKACLEKKRSEGGTFSAPFRRDVPAGRLRVTSVKSKSKYRIVTCQPAFVKRVLDKPMKYFYDRISRFKWLVRGDVSVGHFRELGGEGTFRSGDYSASTDYLNRDAVLEVVAAMCELLDEQTADVLMRSFKDIECVGRGKIKCGSMMGSKCSFVVLCIINAFVVDNAIGNCNENGFVRFSRSKLVNGDDSAFRCSDQEFELWQKYAAWVGFRVNLDKTMCSDRFVEINSQVYDHSRDQLIPKPSFGFLRGAESGVSGFGDEWVEDPWDALFRTVSSGLSHYATKAFVLTHYLVRNVLERSGVSPNLLSIPRRFHTLLFKKRWFRSIVVSRSSELVETVDPPLSREVDYIYGPVLDDETDAIVVRAEEAAMIEYKRKWDGVPFKPERPLRDKTPLIPPPMRVGRGPVSVRRLWIRSVYEEFKFDLPTFDWVARGWTPELLLRDHPEYVLRRDCVVVRNDNKNFAPILGSGWVGVSGEQFHYQLWG